MQLRAIVDVRLGSIVALCVVVACTPMRAVGPSVPSLQINPGATSSVSLDSSDIGSGYSRIDVLVPRGNYVGLDVWLKDYSEAALPGTLALEIEGPGGESRLGLSDSAIRSERSGTQMSLSPVVKTGLDQDALTTSAFARIDGPLAGRRIVLRYKIDSASHFSRATLKLTFRYVGYSLSSFLGITASPRVEFAPKSKLPPNQWADQPVVTVSRTLNGATFGTGIPFGGGSTSQDQIETGGFDPTVDNNRLFVGLDDVLYEFSHSGGNAGIKFVLPTKAHRPKISGMATLSLRDDQRHQMIYVTDMSCADCYHGDGVGVIAFPSDPIDGIGADSIPGRIRSVRVAPSVSRRAIGDEPLGICAIGPTQGSASASGTLFVAEPSGVFEWELSDRDDDIGLEVVGVRRLAAIKIQKMPTGLAVDRVFGPVGAVYVGDRDHNAVLRVDVRTSVVTTYAKLPGEPASLTIDPFTETLYVSIPEKNAIYAISKSAVPRKFVDIKTPQGLAFDAQSASIVVAGEHGLELIR